MADRRYLVGIGHVARSGKDTAAAALVERLGFRRDALADDLKGMALAIDPLIDAELHLSEAVRLFGMEKTKDAYPEARRFLQRLGTEGVRGTFGDKTWTNRVLERAKPGERVVIPDVRFPDEAKAVYAAGGLMIRVDRPGFVGSGHPSETALAGWDGWDVTIVNNGTACDLRRRVIAIVTDWLRR